MTKQVSPAYHLSFADEVDFGMRSTKCPLDVRTELAEAAHALQQAGIPVPQSVHVAQDKLLNEALDESDALANRGVEEARGVTACLQASFNFALTSLGSVEEVLERLDQRHHAYVSTKQRLDQSRRGGLTDNHVSKSVRRVTRRSAVTLDRCSREAELLRLSADISELPWYQRKRRGASNHSGQVSAEAFAELRIEIPPTPTSKPSHKERLSVGVSKTG